MKTKYVLFVIALICFIFSLLWHFKFKERDKLERDPLSTGTELTNDSFPKTFIDVGIQKLHVPVKVDFPIFNTGRNNLYIKKVLPDCHCTVADFSSAPILPNHSSLIILKYDASSPGPFQSSGLVTTNSSSTPSLLIFRGIVEK